MKEDEVNMAEAIADGFELEAIEPRLEFGLYDWIGEHCGVDPNIPGGGCTW